MYLPLLVAISLALFPGPANAGDAANVAGDEGRATALAIDLQSAFSRIAERTFPGVVGVAGYVRDENWTREALHESKGQAWIESHAEELLYPGFRRFRSGSGFVAGPGSAILTCDHLLRGPDGRPVPVVSLELRDGSHVLGEVVGSEPTIDLAVLRFGPFADARKLGFAPLTLGDGDRVQVGHWAIALGDPAGPGQTYQVGVVSARAERLCYQEQLSQTLMQMSFEVPPGGLGGPLVDIHGAVFGMSVRTPGALGEDVTASAFVLPIGLARNIAEALEVGRSTRSPWIGVSVLEMSELRRRPVPPTKGTVFPRTGIYIDNVFDPSPAAAAGIRPGDFLVMIEGSRVLSVFDFQKALYMYGIGSTIRLGLLRDARDEERTLTIEERPQAAAPR